LSYYIGIDLGGTNIRAALFEEKEGGFTLISSKKKVLSNREPHRVISELKDIIDLLSSDQPKISAIGIGVAGMVSSKTQVVKRAPNLDWTDFDLGNELFIKTKIPTSVINDLNAICLGEFSHNPQIKNSLLAVYLGTGIGGALIMDRKLIEGEGGVTGEIGHTKVDISESAQPCGCGKNGCIEAYLGGKNFTSWMEQLKVKSSPQEALFSEISGDIHPGKIDMAAQNGNKAAIDIMDKVASYLGMVLANAVTLTDPGTLLLGGTVWDGSPYLREKTIKIYEMLVNPLSKARIVSGTLGENAGLYGAAHRSYTCQEKK
jgi:glucokinase